MLGPLRYGWGLFFLVLGMVPVSLAAFQDVEGQWEAQYTFRLDLGMAREYQARLRASGSRGLFTWGALRAAEKETTDYEFNLTLGAADSVGSYTQTDLESGKMLSRIPFAGGEAYTVCEPLPGIPWRFTGAVRKLGPWDCQQALGEFRGREYEVWFTPEVAVAIGPWKLQGIPGLVVLATDQAGAVTLTLTSWKPSGEGVPWVETPEDCLDVKSYAELQREWAARLMRRLKARMPRGAQLSLGEQNALERFD